MKHNIKPSKWHNIITVRDTWKFDSKKEAKYYEELKLRQKAGDVIMFLRQTTFHLPGHIKYNADFTEFLPDGSVRFVDTKGKRTSVYKMKKKLVERTYPIEIIEV
jgi:hypothetical protein